MYLGKYEIRETKAPYGMIKNDEVYTAELVYAQSDLMKTLFESAMAADKERFVTEVNNVIDRKSDTGSYYLS